ncbi:tRNA (adenosine(37)-N6)-dimethylallyltransferase MiaA [bacterium]|nr:MAG: tRNA (adenosine(37)-N6)-dimethylallyltransferase MiaA [bacterium]
MKDRIFVQIITGPTASGKSRLAMELAQIVPLEIINADSMQIYRGMDIGTAKPDREDRKRVPHHLLDIREPDEPFSVGEYNKLFREVVHSISKRGRLPVMVGGTGLYIRVAMRGIFPGPPRDEELRSKMLKEEKAEAGILYRRLQKVDPESADRIHAADLVRIIRALEVFDLTSKPMSVHQSDHDFNERPYRTDLHCLNPPRERLVEWIDARVDRMMEMGLLEEVRTLKKLGYGPALNSMKGLGYKEMMSHLQGDLGFHEAVELIKRNTRRFAKRQMTWFRAEKDVHWHSIESENNVGALAKKIASDLAEKDKFN